MSWSGILKSSVNTLRRSESLYWSLQSYSQQYFSSNWNTYLLTASIILKNDWYGDRNWFSGTGTTRYKKISPRNEKRMMSSWVGDAQKVVESGKDDVVHTTLKADLKDALLTLANVPTPIPTPSELISLWQDNILNPSTQLIALSLKSRIYPFAISSLKNSPNGPFLEQLFALFHSIPKPHLSNLDYSFYISLLIESKEIGMIESCLEEAGGILSRDEFLKLLSSVIGDVLQASSSPDTLLYIFSSTVLKYNGTLELLSNRYRIERSILKSIILHYLSSSPSALVDGLKSYASASPYFGSLLITSCIDILGQPGNNYISTILELWDLKLSLNCTSELDLSRVMTALYHNQKYEAVLDIYDNHPTLHASWQFDILLLSLAKLKDWERLQTVFESLFALPNLPGIQHYTIVLRALSELGNVDIVDTVFNSLLERSMKPSIEILHGLMYSRLALGETVGVEYFFNKIKDFGLRPNARSYNILLRSYRDSHDVKKSLLLVGKMAQLNIPITKHAITNLISTCNEKRDNETAEAIFDWALSYGIRPDTIMYNSLISCYMECNLISKAEKLYEIMKTAGPPRIDTLTSLLIGYGRLGRQHCENIYDNKVKALELDMTKYKMSPDEKWLSSLMNYYSTTKNYDKVEEIFNSIESKYHVNQSSYHYTILMESYIRQREFEKAELVYKNMKVNNVIPTFKTQETYLRLKIANPDRNIRQESGSILQEFLDAKDTIDLESRQLPRNVIPFSMVKKVATEYMKTGDYEAALEFLKPYSQIDGYDPKEMFKVSAFLLELYGHAGYWSLVEKTWGIFVDQVSRVYVPVRVVTTATNGNEQQLPSYQKQLPKRYRGTFSKAINSKLNQLHNFRQHSNMIELLEFCRNQGFGVTSQNVNTLVKGFLSDDDYLIKGFEMAEKYLAPTTVAKLRAKGLKIDNPLAKVKYRKYNLSVGTLKLLIKLFHQLIAIMAYENKCSRIKAFLLFKEKYPNLMKLFKWRQRDEFGIRKMNE